MNHYLGIKSPCEKQASDLKSDFGLHNHGLTKLRKVYWNLPSPALYEEIVFRREAKLTMQGPVAVNTGKHSARAANDKYVVRESSTEDRIWWGQYNRPYAPEKFSNLLQRLQAFLQDRDVFVQDCYAGADPQYRMKVRVISEWAVHSLFARNMFITERNQETLRTHVPEFTVISVPSFKAIPTIDSTLNETFIAVNFEKRLAIIGNTGYGGEIKKTIFTVLNFLLPFEGVMPMHCSANVGPSGDSALFFGLSGTGKTTLSADPGRRLIGDDEHGWSDAGIFNFEGGCYAKVIRLSPTAEPEIYACTRKFGTVLENVVFDDTSRRLDLDDDKFTENTRCAYPIEYIDNIVKSGLGGHPKNVILLTCDASGVMPPIARLNREQSIYHFISGYTSKVAGTEIGLGIEPEITFSACFGAPFMVHHPYAYAELLAQKIERYGVTPWLVNTGWTGGPYGVGKRMSIRHTRALLNAALEGRLDNVEYKTDPIFGFEVPTSCEGVPADVLDPSGTWPDRAAYNRKYDALAARFIENFKLYEAGCPEGIASAGPTRLAQAGSSPA